MAGTGCPGVEPLSQQRASFARLIAQGMSNTEACRTVGVNRRTGTRWRFGRSVPTAAGSVREYPPWINKPVVVLSPRFLSADERAVIAHEHNRGRTVRATAALLGRSPSTVSRELGRNTTRAGCTGAAAAPARPAAPATARLRMGCCGRSSSSAWTCGGAWSRSRPPCSSSGPTTHAGSCQRKACTGAVHPRHGAGPQPAHRP